MPRRVLSSWGATWPTMWFLGFGFYWAAWFSEGFKSSTWLSVGSNQMLAEFGFLLGTIPFAGTFLLIMGFSRWLAPLHERLWLLTIAAVISGAGLLVVGLGKTAQMDMFPAVAIVVMMQIAAAVQLAAWGELCAHVGVYQASVGAAASTVVGTLLHIVLMRLHLAIPAPTAAVLAVFPALSVASLVMAWRQPLTLEMKRAEKPDGAGDRFVLPVHTMVVLAAYGFSVGFMVNLTTLHHNPGAAVASVTASFNGVASLALLVYAALRPYSDTRFLYWPTLMLFAMAFMLLPVAGYGVANSVAHAGIACVAVLWLSTCAELARSVPPLKAVGMCAFANAGGSALGCFVCSLLLSFGGPVTVWHLSTAALAIVVAQMLATAPLISGRTITDKITDLIGPVHAPSKEQLESVVDHRCTDISREFGLTPREREILGLLAVGNTPDFIGQELVISQATVRTHIKRIHEKLDVHSQPQLMQMVVFEPSSSDLAQVHPEEVTA